MDQLLKRIRSFDGVLELAPSEGSEFPEIAWGDYFFYYAPDGQVLARQQPYATILTKNYPDEAMSNLDEPERWRLNIHVGATMFVELTGETPRSPARSWDYAATDVIVPHPVYRQQGWVSIINPSVNTSTVSIRLLRQAHEAAHHRAEHRRPHERAGGEPGAGDSR
ncbi:DUF6194 family protein [Arthrobacter sp. SX1312]|uniref:DUF6194 family protein n=1 Tax=Arthrobacter sp. SX1312 TaxID=2058896 RepID=UPI0015E217E4|nr:DUF6194 family protein [Arthrobacter sp. SX1312]